MKQLGMHQVLSLELGNSFRLPLIITIIIYFNAVMLVDMTVAPLNIFTLLQCQLLNQKIPVISVPTHYIP